MVAKLTLASSIKVIPLIGPVYQKKLASFGILTVEDLLYYFPFRYEDLSEKKSIADCVIGETITIKATLWQITKLRTKTGKTIIKATVNDSSGALDIIWFNQVYLLTVLKPNMLVNFSGKVGMFANKKTLFNPSYEIIKDLQINPIHTERLVPIYSESTGVSSKWLRTKIFNLLESSLEIRDFLDTTFLSQQKLIDLKTALSEIHFPTTFEKATKARERLAFDELLMLHLSNLQQKKLSESKQSSVRFNYKKEELNKFQEKLSFKLTSSQLKAISEIENDLNSKKPMNRLLQGEVGSGKTVVSAFPILACILSGYQAVLLAPTEILARQHFQTINEFLKGTYKIELHTSSSKANSSDFDVVVGTHAVLNQNFEIKNPGLIVIDEQQRFGVVQRSFLKNQKSQPHFLTMTATPIPRTLALTIYGNLDISVLDEIPSGRQRVKTYVVNRAKRNDAYTFVKKELDSKGQAFIICPLIEVSETLVSVKSAKEEFDRLKKEVFPTYKLGLLHGKLKSIEKETVVAAFREGKIDILVSTPVVEVGIDIPNASIMLIEAAERFGLSSLHQLRGRVGRGNRQSYCLIFSESQNMSVMERLKLLEKYNNGLQLAEMDLEKRGPGDLFGTAQSGQFNLKLLSSVNLELIVKSRKAAQGLINDDLNQTLLEKISKLSKNEILSD